MPYVSQSAIKFARENPTLLGVRIREAVSRHELRQAVKQRMKDIITEKEAKNDRDDS